MAVVIYSQYIYHQIHDLYAFYKTITMTDFEEISRRAEQDLNSYQAKTGEARRFGVDDAGANTYQAETFPGAEATQGDDLSTNRGWDKRIPPSEGGITDDRGR